MHEANLFKIFVEHLNRGNIQYMVTGSVACIVYGEPRLTHDIDLVLELHAEQIEDFRRLFPADEFYCPPAEVVKAEINRQIRGHFNIIHQASGFKADIYPIGNDTLHTWAFARRRKAEFEQTYLWLAPPEYVIIRKLEYYKEGKSYKHLRDIQRMLDISSDIIDKDMLRQKITERNLDNEWQELAKST